MKIEWKEEGLSLAMIIVMLVLAIVSWPTAPDRIPIHWTFSGEPDGFADRSLGLIGLPLLAVGVYLVLLFLPRLDPRRAHYDLFRAPYSAIRTTIIGLLLAMDAFIHLWIRGYEIGTLFMPLTAGIVIMVLGNYLPKLKSNWFIGIRTPWTLSSEEAWRKTHRLAGWLFVAAGAVIVAASVFDPNKSRVVLFATLMPAVLVSVVYSYFAWRKDPNKTVRA